MSLVVISPMFTPASASDWNICAATPVCVRMPPPTAETFETFVPSRLFELLAAGRPIIGAVRGEARDILARSGGALLVEPERGDLISNPLGTRTGKLAVGCVLEI